MRFASPFHDLHFSEISTDAVNSMRVILYCRASTEDQQITLQSQQAKLSAYAEIHDLDVVEMIVESESAKSLNREGIQRVLAMLKSGQADGLAVLKLDRLTRSVADWQTLITEHFSERAGKQLFSVQDSIDTRSAAGRLVLNVLLSVAAWERETIAERTRDALQHKISRRERVGKVRFGFTLADDGVNLIPNEDEQSAIALMQSLRTEGQSLRTIAAELTSRGIPTKERRTEWTHKVVAKILAR
jgi:site-specific DNA recombinase